MLLALISLTDSYLWFLILILVFSTFWYLSYLFFFAESLRLFIIATTLVVDNPKDIDS